NILSSLTIDFQAQITSKFLLLFYQIFVLFMPIYNKSNKKVVSNITVFYLANFLFKILKSLLLKLKKSS
ncbi:hypothetical protein, partial [Heyndrickxia sporothermodurans]|uniref:hypothetical protein n=1 Tax=Heyndrickxia sporothermodurans TaxID=46224 RepID=UPI00196B30C5